MAEFEFVVDSPDGIVNVEIDTEMLLSWAKANYAMDDVITTAANVHEYLNATDVVRFLRDSGNTSAARFTPTDSHWAEGSFWGLEKSDQ